MADRIQTEGGSRFATLLAVERVQVHGHPHFRLVYKFAGEAHGRSRVALLRNDQVYQTPRYGDRVWIQFCFTRVLRIDKAC